MVFAIIVAAGKGVRMQTPAPKQYLPLGELPLLCHTLQRVDASGCDGILLVVPPEDIDFCRERILEPISLSTQTHLVPGGDRRQDSVYNGLTAIPDPDDDDLVAVHDGVRPFVSPTDMRACIQVASHTGACILGRPAADTLKQVVNGQRIRATMDRSLVWRAETPQVFRYRILLEAHRAARNDNQSFTDDSAMVEHLGIPVHIQSASGTNLKITTPEDLVLAKTLFSRST